MRFNREYIERKRALIFPVIVLAAAGALHFFSRERGELPPRGGGAGGTAVAVVDGEWIFLEDIMPDRENLRAGYPDLPPEEFTDVILRAKKANLVRIIGELVFERQIRESGLAPSEEELAEYAEEFFKQSGMTEEIAGEMIMGMRAIAAALGEWQENPEKSGEIYADKLEPLDIPEPHWEAMKRQYDTPGKVEEMLSMLPEDFADMKVRSRPGFERELMERKLREAFSPAVSVSEEEAREDYELIYGSLPAGERPDFDDVKDELLEELESWKREKAFGEWRRRQYVEAGIEIKDERFEGILQFLF